MPEKEAVKMVVNKLELKKSKPASEFNNALRELQHSESARDIVRFCEDHGVQKFELKTKNGTFICVFQSKETSEIGDLKQRAHEREGKGTGGLGLIPG